jgi:serine/threonine protein kinase
MTSIPLTSSGDALRDRLAAALAPAYTVEAELGRGGMSVVYRAHDVRLRRDVAVKVLPPELAFVANVRERFMREAQTAAQLAHPHIVPIYGVGERDTLVWIVMALIEGETLGMRLSREGRIDGPETERILGGVADALAYAHAHGVIHRDIKPDNILIERDSKRVLVTDFGIARAAEGDGRLTLTGVAVGTPTYMSPEQAIGDGEVDGRTDLYSLGIVGYQMLAGAPPFTANSTPALMLKQVSEPLPPLASRAPSAPVALVAAIERALAKKPADRWASLADFARAVRDPQPHAVPEAPSWPSDARQQPVAPPVIGVPAMPKPSAPADAPWNSATAAREPRPLPPPPMRAPSIPAPPRPPVPLAGANAVPAWVYGASADSKSIALQAQSFRRHFRSTFGVLAMLGVINAATSPHFAWVVFPAFGMLMGLSARWRPLGDAGLSFMDVVRNEHALQNAGVEGSVPATLFTNSLAGRARRFGRRIAGAAISAGVAVVSLVVGASFHVNALIPVMIGSGVISLVSLVSAMRAVRPLRRLGFRRRDILNGTWRDSEAARSVGTAFRLREEEVSQLAPPDVVMSAYGERLRLAVEDRTAIRQLMARLVVDNTSMMPEMMPTVEDLVQRIAEICGALHHLDRDMRATFDTSLDARIAELRMRGVPDSDATLSLLLRQRQSLADLEGRRSSLRGKLDSASHHLQGLRLDVMKLASIGSATPQFRDVGMATEQARALSRDIGYLLEGAREADRAS